MLKLGVFPALQFIFRGVSDDATVIFKFLLMPLSYF